MSGTVVRMAGGASLAAVLLGCVLSAPAASAAMAMPAGASREPGTSVAARLAELEDREAIRLVLRDYGKTLDERRFDDFGKLFAAEAEYVTGPSTLRGPAQIADGLRRIFAGNSLGIPEPNFHVLFNERIELQGDHAHSTSQSFYVAPGADGAPRIILMASYEDELVRTAEGWRFARRIVHSNMAPRPPSSAPSSPASSR